ncbi:MAG: hypothetical protein AAF637_19875 [Pseudomonadota bacterium]
MSRLLRAALVAAMVAATFALAPPAIAEKGTLKVTARVVNRCTVAVPPRVAASHWRQWRHAPRRFVRHKCQRHVPYWFRAAKAWYRYRDDRGHRRGRVHHAPHSSRDGVILVTITY